jgi:hypothetical protein
MWSPATCLLLASWAALITAQPLQVSFDSCASGYTQASARLNVSDVFAVIVPGDEAQQLGLAGDGQDVLRLNIFGQATDTILGYSNDTNKLGTSLQLSGKLMYSYFTSRIVHWGDHHL